LIYRQFEAAAFRQLISVLQSPALEERHPVPLFVASLVEVRPNETLGMPPLNLERSSRWGLISI
jgi:hypothetical protein